MPVDARVADGAAIDGATDAAALPHDVLVGDDVLDLRAPNGRPIAQCQGQRGRPTRKEDEPTRGRVQGGGNEDGESEGNDRDGGHHGGGDLVPGGDGDDLRATSPNDAFTEKRISRQSLLASFETTILPVRYGSGPPDMKCEMAARTFKAASRRAFRPPHLRD